MEGMAGLEPSESDAVDDERETAIVSEVFDSGDNDGDSGDLAPLVAEYHWESGTNEPEQSALTLWVEH